MKKSVSLFVLLLVSVVLVVFPPVEVVNASQQTIVVPDDYSTIQEAVDAAHEGDVVFVKSGTYSESVSIDQPISLVGEDPATTTIIGDYRLNGTVVLVRHDNVSVTGFTVQPSAYSFSRKGVHLLHVRYCSVVGNIILNNGYGVWLYGASENNITGNTVDGSGSRSTGILADDSPNNLIFNNIVTDHYSGIGLWHSADGNTVCNNTVIDNCDAGISVSSNGNNITGNVVSNQVTGVILSGSNNVLRANKINNNSLSLHLNWNQNWDVSDFVNDIDSSNTINGKPIIYWVNKQDKKVPEDAQFVVLVNCTNITVENLVLPKNGQDIILVATTDSTIQNNSVHVSIEGIVVFASVNNKIRGNMLLDCGRGVYLVSSFQNTVMGNSIKGGSQAIRLVESNENIVSDNVISGGASGGIDLDGSDNNEILKNTISDCKYRAVWFWNNAFQNMFYLNNFSNNTKNVEEYITEFQEFPKNIWDNGTTGNYWSNYNGTDTDGDDIGDTPYVIDKNNMDNHPLMKPVDVPELFDGTGETAPFPTLLVIAVTVTIVALVAVAVIYRLKLSKSNKRGGNH
jgi:parallel beta-helix repeat protein